MKKIPNVFSLYKTDKKIIIPKVNPYIPKNILDITNKSLAIAINIIKLILLVTIYPVK